MGATTSTSGYQMPPTSSNGGGSSGLLLPSSAALTGSASGSGGGPGGNSSLMGVAGVGVPHFREQRRKRVTGFATLKRKFIRRRRSSKACDHARVLRDFVSDWTPLELAALCEEYEALAALRDLSVIQNNITRAYQGTLCGINHFCLILGTSGTGASTCDNI